MEYNVQEDAFMDYKSIYEQWCSDPYFDEATKAELKALEGDEKEIEDLDSDCHRCGRGGCGGGGLMVVPVPG